MRLLCLIIFFPVMFFTQTLDLEKVRMDYHNAVAEKELCREMLQSFEKKEHREIYLAYYGALQAVWAKHTSNPFEKLKSFNSGRRNLDAAISQQPDLFEARFLRYAIQKESPAFLRYKDDMKEDREFLLKNIGEIQSPLLKKMSYQILKIEK